MKKFLVLFASMMTACMAYAYYWNVDWCIYDALSPKASGSYPDSISPSLLTDYSVTWSLVYGDAIEIDRLTGELVAGTYTQIDQTGAIAGATGLQWTDNVEGGITAEFDDTLYALTSSTRYLGNAPDDNEYNVHQFIRIENANDASEIYYWLSEGTLVKPTTDLTSPIKDLGTSIEIGTKNTPEANAYWTPVPEPATMSLLGLGALAMVLRRKLRK